MVRLTRIYTRTGDEGKTSLGDGARVDKHNLRVDAYGTVDEANAVLGLARLHASGTVAARLAAIQNDLFDLGADLCTPLAQAEKPGAALRMIPPQVERLESEIDAANAGLAPLDSFVLPAGSPRPIRVTATPSGLSCSDTKCAVASLSTSAPSARTTSDGFSFFTRSMSAAIRSFSGPMPSSGEMRPINA